MAKSAQPIVYVRFWASSAEKSKVMGFAGGIEIRDLDVEQEEEEDRAGAEEAVARRVRGESRRNRVVGARSQRAAAKNAAAGTKYV